MQVTINDQLLDIPFDLSEITLSKYVGYYDKYGRELDKQLVDLLEKKYEGDDDEIEISKQIDLDNHIDNEALSWVSYFSGFDLFEVRTEKYIQPLLSQYRVLRFVIKESLESALEFPQVIEWNGDQWFIQDFKINPSSEMSFNEIITSKEVIRQIHRLSKGKWDAMQYLCAIFFRKKDEAFSDALVDNDSERMKVLNDLPMTYVLKVAFFLSSCVNTWSNTLAYSPEKEVEKVNQN